MSEAVEKWVASLHAEKRSDKEVRGKRAMMLRFANELNWNSVADITREQVSEVKSMLGDRSPRYINNSLSRLSVFLKFCIQCGWIQDNPADHIDRPANKTGQGQRPFTLEEVERLIKITPIPRCHLYQFAAFSGMRWRECSLLRWSMYVADATKPHLILPDNLVKNKKGGPYPLLPLAAEAVASMMYDGRRPEDPIFQRPDPNTINTDMKRAGVPKHDIHGQAASFHSFRHFFSRELDEHDLPLEDIQILMRHSDIRTTQRIYLDKQIFRARDRAAEALGVAKTIPKSRRTT
ncbi:MAG: tyrosine-type recombinase/integrase [Planctomycetota bacterium]